MSSSSVTTNNTPAAVATCPKSLLKSSCNGTSFQSFGHESVHAFLLSGLLFLLLWMRSIVIIIITIIAIVYLLHFHYFHHYLIDWIDKIIIIFLHHLDHCDGSCCSSSCFVLFSCCCFYCGACWHYRQI